MRIFYKKSIIGRHAVARMKDERGEPMATKKNTSLSSRLSRQKTKTEQPSILQEEEKKWNWTQILTFVLLVYVGMNFMYGCFAIIDLKAQENVVVAQIREEEATQETLKSEVSHLKTDEAVEKTAREDLKMVKPGEILLTQRKNTNKDKTEDKTNSQKSTNKEQAESSAADTE